MGFWPIRARTGSYLYFNCVYVMILDCCRIIRIFSCPLLMTNWRKNYSFHLPAHRANVIIVVKVKCVQFTLKPLHYLTVPSHICSQDQHHNFLQRHNYIFSIKKPNYCTLYLSLLFHVTVYYKCLTWRTFFWSSLHMLQNILQSGWLEWK